MKLDNITAVILALSIITFGVLVGLGKVEAAAFAALISSVVHALLPALVQRPPSEPPAGKPPITLLNRGAE